MRKNTLFLLILAIIFLFFYFWLVTPIKTSVPVSERFDWPDEVANYYWINQYAHTGQLSTPMSLNALAQNQIYPRSFNVRADGTLVPGSFLGMILIYGNIAKIIGTKLIIYLTPLLAILAVLAFYGVIKRFFNEQIATLSSLMMFFHPAWWYYSATPMLNNIAFISLILFSIFLLLQNLRESIKISGDGTWGVAVGFMRSNKSFRLTNLISAAVLGGLALAIRPSEFIWVFILYILIFYYQRQFLDWKRFFLFIVVIALVIFPSFYYQKSIFGGWSTTGYSQLNKINQSSCQSCQILKSLFLPFGFHPVLIAYNFLVHFIVRLWWFSLLAIMGFLLYFVGQKNSKNNKVFFYTLSGMITAVILMIYYGSWEFSDKLTLNLNTLGISYVRYWLPIYLFSLPFVATAVIWLSRLFPRRLRIAVLVLITAFMFYRSASLVLTEKPDSILPVKNRIVEYKKLAQLVFDVTPPDAVIVTVRKDKVFFPERMVIHTFEALSINKDLMAVLPGLVKAIPVYYYALGPEPNLDLDFGLQLTLVKEFGREVLYEIKVKE